MLPSTRSRQMLCISLWLYYMIGYRRTVLIFLCGYSVGYHDFIGIFGFVVGINYFFLSDGDVDNEVVLFQ